MCLREVKIAVEDMELTSALMQQESSPAFLPPPSTSPGN